MRPSERAPDEGLRSLGDDEAPDFLERHAVALLAFLDLGDPACAKMHQRLSLVAAKWQTAGPAAASPAAGSLARFGAGVVDVARHRLVAEALGVKAVPTVLLFADGQVVDRLMGTPPESVLDDVVKARMGGPGG
jgi:thioredoxin 1